MKILLEQIKCPVDSDDAYFKRAVYEALLSVVSGRTEYADVFAQISAGDLDPAMYFSDNNLKITRKTIDARKKAEIKSIYNVVYYHDENPAATPSNSLYHAAAAAAASADPGNRPVIVGFGPAGIFAAMYLAQQGFKPLIIERGCAMETRVRNVEKFWNEGILDPESNVQFGEGGAGTFSDGKLTTGVKDELLAAVLETFVDAGAPRDILYHSNPHVGTDVIRAVIVRIRNRLAGMGAEIRFETKLTGIRVENGQLSGITIVSNRSMQSIETKSLILATGHSARDTVRMLYHSGLHMEAKPFAAGFRIEHLQKKIDMAQFGVQTPAVMQSLGPASYKMVSHLPSGRAVYTFCMCPGGRVIAGSSAPGQVVTNGMSYHSRSETNSNSALLVNITPEDFKDLRGDIYDDFRRSPYYSPTDEADTFSGCAGGDRDPVCPDPDRIHPLAGFLFQEAWEYAAFVAGGSDYRAPAQYLEEFLYGHDKTASKVVKSGNFVLPTYTPGVVLTDLQHCMPDFVSNSIREALPDFGNKIKGFASPGALLTGIETRSSSPVRIVRDSQKMSNISGIYPCGEGAGYAGGIMSAAIDGIRCAMSFIAQAAID
ncbi:MAG: NAD(P)/FAD-dependent oxidoreductase [Saccharofermentanales bacterium]